MQGARAQLPASAPVQQGAPRGAIAMPPIKKAATARARNAAKGRAALRSKQRLAARRGGAAPGRAAGTAPQTASSTHAAAAAPLVGAAALSFLRGRQPVLVEGRAGGDPRCADEVAGALLQALRARRGDLPRPVVVTQGDPAAERGVAALSRRVASALGAPRVVVTLDAHLDPEHHPNADREGAAAELWLSELEALLEPRVVGELEAKVEELLARKDAVREAEGKAPLRSYYRQYALLQEVTKAGVKALCGGLTLCHSCDPGRDTVTSFYEAGLAVGLYDRGEVCAFGANDGAAAG